MKQVTKISLAELKKMAEKMYGSIVKADVDVTKKIVLVDMDLHSDGEAYLMEHGSKQEDMWGINLQPDKYGTNEFVEFDSMINYKSSQGNDSRGVNDKGTRNKIIELIEETVHE
ncbi:hypothetical protein HYW36_01015 [Candidatus Saccharibacteria bacterium]|nr:hypothetical protein [Candidatus Saccharibacteria bacterium]